tara:strand:- start:506 stop:2026 length:1521 start_codon:yes stop_codon:yes gene_type:complete
MALTTIKTGAIADDAVTTDKLANAINTERTANTAKDLTALSASNLTSGTVPDARFPATLPAASATNLTAVPAANITGTLPAISAANLTNIPAANITGTLPAISATNLTNIPAANITGTLPAISGANLTGISSAGKAKNLIINGAMQVAQRATSSTNSNGYHTVDRWSQEHGSTDEAPTFSTFEVSPPSSPYHLPTSGDHPYKEGFRTAWGVTNGNQTSGAGADDYVLMGHAIEAQNIATCGWNYTDPNSYITLSFWIKSSVSQEFFGQILSQDGSTYNYPFGTGSLTAMTWTKVTKTIPGNANLTFNNDYGSGLRLYLWPFAGTNLTGSVTQNAWSAVNWSQRVPDSTSTWYTTNDASLQITGVQLEVGDSATDFAHETYADELIRCMRYYQIVIMSGHPNGGGQTGGLGGTMYSNGSSIYCPYRFPVEMRTEPSVESSSGTGSGSGTFRTRLGDNHSFNNFTGFNDGNAQSGTFITNGNASGGSVGDYVWIETNSGAKLALDAEI